MADDEQFSLCWNNFNSNLSAGFHESLCRGDLVDVTLAAEGQLVKAHRLVLSVCSPYFRKMFTQMPANQHAFVFLKDVSHTALKDLIQFMYCGEVNVKQEALPAFISTAEALQIKGLTDSDPPAPPSPAEPSAPQPQLQQITSPRVRQRTTNSRSTYKIDTLDDNGDKMQQQPAQIVIQTTAAPQQQTTINQQHIQTLQHVTAPVSTGSGGTTTATLVSHKRAAQRSSIGSISQIKRTKSTIDPLEMSEMTTAGNSGNNNNQQQQQQIQIQTTVVPASSISETKSQHATDTTEYIDLPMEMTTKAEPEYVEDAGDVDAGDNDGTGYVEDDAYGDMRYDETYFTENEDGQNTATATVSSGAVTSGSNTATTSKAVVVKQQPTSFSDTSYVETGDQSNNDAQDYLQGNLLKIKSEKASDVCSEGYLLKNRSEEESHISSEGYELTASFGLSEKNRPILLIDNHKFHSDNVKYVTKNNYESTWRCSMYIKKLCKARASTKIVGKDIKYRLTHPFHTH